MEVNPVTIRHKSEEQPDNDNDQEKQQDQEQEQRTSEPQALEQVAVASAKDEVTEFFEGVESDDEPAVSKDNDNQNDNDKENGSEAEDNYEPELQAEPQPELASPSQSQAQSQSQPEAQNEEEDDDYDPTAAFKEDDHEPQPKQETEEDDFDYDPEGVVVSTATTTNPISHESPPVVSSILKGKTPPAGLPPKPPVIAKVAASPTLTPMAITGDAQQELRDAYSQIMQSDLVNNPGFVNLSQAEQMKLIVNELTKKDIQLNSSRINYDQVYSYNKPFKNLKDPIPLIPINEYCRRPNITAPMTPEEEEQYDEFIKTESYYMDLQNWDEFPDKSRLFIGNLPANTISKQDLFRIFSQYGDVIQIAIKAGYGFAQFRTAEACYECIKGETNVPLHNKIMRLDASKPQKSRRAGRPDINNPNLSSSGRERFSEEGNNKKKRKILPDCQIYITGKSSVYYIRKVKKAFASSQITVDTEDVTHRDINDVISEAAYSGVLGTCVVKELKVDVQTFESTPDGGVKFDEYADVDPEVAADILSKAKVKKYGNNMPTYYPQDTSYNDNSLRSQSSSQSQSQPYGYQGQGSSRGPNPYDNPYSRKRSYNDESSNQRSGGSYGGGHSRGGRGNSRSGRDRGGPSYANPNQNWSNHQQAPPPSTYGQQQQYPYGGHGGQGQGQGQGQYYNQPNSQYGQQQQPPYNQYSQSPNPNTQPNVNPNQNPDPNAIMQQLQGMNPAELQQLVSTLQQQQQHSPPQQQISPFQQSQGYGGAPPRNNYGGGYGQQQSPYGGPQQSPSGQVESLLSRIQSNNSGYSQPPPQQQSQQRPSSQQQSQQTPYSSQALLDTLAKLTKK
ncbi:uncharacterized protein RJT21DRAFT_119408 [Scheffersomyces amazonensis]|uniref:uncharacterized protein n=1 Tax=Scheffersomyces amazonensis TaxID=1078765 RepID=UPI00315D8999